MAARRGALILAAGASHRMGTPKALLPWRGVTLLEHALTQAACARVDDVIVVLGPATAHLRLACKTAFNPTPDSGRSTSIRLGAARLSDDCESILIQSVDQPTSASVLDALFGALVRAEVAVPTYAGRRGHPICVSAGLRSELEALSEADQGLRALVRRHVVTEVPVDDESVTWNLNDPAAYAAALARR